MVGAMRTLGWFVIASVLAQAPVGEPRAHPDHSVGPDVPPEIPMSVYEKRRRLLSDKLGNCAAAIRAQGGADGGIDQYFFYLTGVEDAGAGLLLSPRGAIVKQALYLPPRDPESEIWTGYKEPMSTSLRKKYRVDEVGRMRGGVPRGLGGALRRSRCLAYLRSGISGDDDVDSGTLGKMLRAYGARTILRWEELERMRSIHDDEEIKRMEKAIAITAEGHRAAIASLRPGVTERKVASDIEDAFFDHGATGLAVPSIVGSSENGAILHWEKRDRTIQTNDLVVVDIGSSYGHYASDVTRTYPVSGKFGDEQRKVYETVLAAQQKAIDAVKPGISLDKLHRIAEEVIVEAGHELPHFVGHYVGLDVHDVGDTGAPLEPGMVITVEPGIYIQGKFGVRIEDEVLVTATGHRLLTSALPRSAAEVEAWMAEVRSAVQGAGRGK
jgi:Xaa-Pro aminopeptidase